MGSVGILDCNKWGFRGKFEGSFEIGNLGGI